uniref:Chromosome 3 C7orf50 homolog n=1 Tax=Macaca mulatta TaxID=9544 RepID=A0A5F8ACM3_MACMU
MAVGRWRRDVAFCCGRRCASDSVSVPVSRFFLLCYPEPTTKEDTCVSVSSICYRSCLGPARELDFLPVKCDACKQDFCKDHFTYAAHKCPFAFQKDVQVPVCPLCNTPIPVKKGQIPDVVVSDHIDRDCDSHPGKKKEKIFIYRCSKEGCKKKEMLQMACAQCHGNFCIQHRHPLDHSCRHGSRPTVKAG